MVQTGTKVSWEHSTSSLCMTQRLRDILYGALNSRPLHLPLAPVSDHNSGLSTSVAQKHLNPPGLGHLFHQGLAAPPCRQSCWTTSSYIR